MDSATHAIEIAELEKRYGDTRAVDGVTLSVPVGEVFGLLGPNGAGKTTTVEILEGYRRADAGEVKVLGLDPWTEGARLRPQIGVMLQSGGLYPGLKPLEALRLFASYYDDPDDPERLLHLVGLDDSQGTMVRRMSGGQQQRLSLALSLVGRPSLVFLDEPTAGMDPHARATTWAMIRELRDAGATVVLTTHAMDEAEHLCDRVAIIDHGRVVACGSPDELMTTAAVAETTFAAAPGTPRGQARGRARTARRRGARARGGRVRRRCRGHTRAGGVPHRVAARRARAPERAALGPAVARRRVPPPHGGGTRVKAAAVRAQTRVETMLTLRRGESLLVTIVIPLGVLVFFTKVDAVNTTLKDPVDFLVPGVLALAVMASAMVSLGIATGYERHYGVLKRLGSTPLSRAGLLTAKTLNVLVLEIIQAVAIIVTGIALGWSASAPRVLLAVALLLVGTIAFAGIGMLMAGTLRAEANLALANGLFLVLLFLGGMAYPLDRLPDALEVFAKLLPAAALSETVRAALNSGLSFPIEELVVLVVWAIGAPLLAARFFTWEE